MNKQTVAVIFGGVTPEYDVSLKSAHSIINAIDRGKYEVVLLGIAKDGQWYRYSGDVGDIPADRWHKDARNLTPAIIPPSRSGGIMEIADGRVKMLPIDVVFPVLHGKNGEDGTVQGLCELAGIPVVGSGSAASALCMDKDRAHKLVSLAGIRVPESVCFAQPPPDDALFSSVSRLKLPLFVKPVKTGSSFGITMVRDLSELAEAVKTAFAYDDAVIIEEGVSGFEAGCSVIGNDELTTGRIDEIELAAGQGLFDYEEKYTLKTSKIHMPARISADTEKRLQDAAVTIYRVLGCRGYARVDMFLTEENEIVFNEANTIPGFTPFSRFPNMMRGAGMEYPQLVDRLIELGIES